MYFAGTYPREMDDAALSAVMAVEVGNEALLWSRPWTGWWSSNDGLNNRKTGYTHSQQTQALFAHNLVWTPA